MAEFAFDDANERFWSPQRFLFDKGINLDISRFQQIRPRLERVAFVKIGDFRREFSVKDVRVGEISLG